MLSSTTPVADSGAELERPNLSQDKRPERIVLAGLVLLYLACAFGFSGSR